MKVVRQRQDMIRKIEKMKNQVPDLPDFRYLKSGKRE
jgi:hypothetical protein